MKKLSKSLFIMPAALLIVGFAGPVMAHGQSGTDGTDNNTNSTETSDSTDTNTQDSTQVRERFRGRADSILSQLEKDGAKRHDASTREKNCQAAQKGLERKLSNLQTNSQKYLDRVNSILEKALSYQQTNNVNPTGFADLQTKASSAQTDATTAVNNLKSLSVSIDCSSGSVAENVAAFKAAAQDAHDKLLAYKTAVKNVVVALLQAKEGGQQ